MYFWDKHKTITSYYELLSGEVCDRYRLTQMEYDILMFLHNKPHQDVYMRQVIIQVVLVAIIMLVIYVEIIMVLQ